MLLGTDRKKLSKRHGAMGLNDFEAAGILPEALFNYLALLGFSLNDDREIATVDEFVSEYTLDRVTHHAAVFDMQKLEWMNGEYIRALGPQVLAERAFPFAEKMFATIGPVDPDIFRAAMDLAVERSTTLVHAAEQTRFLWVPDDALTIDAESWEIVRSTERADEILDVAIAHIRAASEWTLDALKLQEPLKAAGFKPRNAMPVLYAAVEGSTVGLPLFDSMYLLGRDRVLARLHAARSRLTSA
jgi:glutamyl-tRNA synthetase